MIGGGQEQKGDRNYDPPWNNLGQKVEGQSIIQKGAEDHCNMTPRVKATHSLPFLPHRDSDV
jgi:hypothetical protein